MKMRLIKQFTLAAAAIILMTAATAKAQTDNGHYDCFSLTGASFFNPCTGEDILITDGEVCIAESFKVDSSGGFHFSFQFKSDFTAVGLTSGASYVEHNAAGENDNANGNQDGFEFTFRQHYHVNTSGPDNNLYVTELFHVTFNANGDLTSLKFVDVFFECK